MDWSALLAVLLPAIIGLILGSSIAVAAKEALAQVRELLQAIEKATEDNELTKEEIALIAKEAQDVKVSVTAFIDAVKRLFKKKE